MIHFRLFLYLICTLCIPRLTFANDHLNVQITSVKLTPDRRPLVTFKVTTAENHPLDLADLNTESVNFTIAAIERDKNGATRYYNYVLSDVSGKSYVY